MDQDEEQNMDTIIMSQQKTHNPSWKLYDNPHYRCLSIALPKSRSSYHTHNLSAFASSQSSSSSSFSMDGDGVRISLNLSDLDNALAVIKELRSELEFERRMRRKVEVLNRALARELEEERRRREETSDTCARLAEEIARAREEAERAVEEVEDERRMLRMAEAMREERVQMKLAEARLLMEEKIKEMTATTTAAKDDEKIAVKCEAENPHIKRGIKGMEFPRATLRVGTSPRSREDRDRERSSASASGSLGSNLECQRAQLRVLMRHKNVPAGAGIGEVSENLVM